ncbi:UDP-N-acetylmuramoyl-tripeptide--D-alanyl-D-alanine ligase [Arenibacter antarcticus]|uniref:UDP-N-acetylmuramoyl-tripeptide--D-alanyl-D-alanine ligase n=1 Tax=Arenibacter antarcticus TaxID=2040469 RepID=A0ABW5VDE5_9FLAO|nr:UDP-N-acetylmuramoyl-tripeptide--D-alanyl-D-alanine ligase [Arenibacter sp. H213]MCM4168453.1 UDP-N-acetylmuramoyl-tripeptide--D-alanyl-D-alanine ligase [Arenibacter sp. H213]
MTTEQLHTLFLRYPVICTDTRKITPNCLFFALKGDNFDGNAYAADAIKKGASYAIIEDRQFASSEKNILVADVLSTLQQLAKFHREYCNAKVIGLTGSNGKTTTKELITAVLSKKYKTIATKGNLNNHIGVPLTLLSITPETEIAIVEMGANHAQEIAFLCQLAKPDYGYITNFGKAHLEGFGSEEGVIMAKSELYDYLFANNKFVFFNADDTIQASRLNLVTSKLGFSAHPGPHLPIKILGADPYVSLEVRELPIESKLVGRYNFTNCSAAVLIGDYFKVPLTDIKIALENYIPQNNRSQIIQKTSFKIVLDAYNANPTSMKAALENFQELKSARKIAFLGDMFELGNAAEKEHQEIANLAAKMDFDQVFLIGENFYKTTTDLHKYKSFDQLAKSIGNISTEEATILIKGSRGMALERLVALL